MKIQINSFCGRSFVLQLARELARRGHEVLFAYFSDNNTPNGDLLPRADDPATFHIEPITLGRAFHKTSPLQRRAADIDFGRLSAEALVRFQPDVVLVSEMPLDSLKILQASAHRHRAAFVFWLQDFLADLASFVLARKSFPISLLARPAGMYYGSLERRLLNESEAIVCIGEYFQQRLQEWRVGEGRCEVIENWAPLNEVTPVERDNEWSRQQGLGKGFRFVYSGTLGMKHRCELLWDLAGLCEERGDAELICVAQGAGADWLAAQQKASPRESLRLMGFQPYELVSQVMGSSDVLITLLDDECAASAIPSKTLSYLCAGRPILMAAPGVNRAAQCVMEAGAGVVTAPESSAFLRAAAQLMDEPDKLASMGASARAYAESHFDIIAIGDRFECAIRDAASRNHV